MITSSSEFYGPENFKTENCVPRHVKFTFKSSVRCQILWITLRLQRPGSRSLNFEKDFNLLSLDENPFAQVSRRSSFGGVEQDEPCLHAKRIIVVGSPVREELGLAPSQNSNQMSIRSLLEKAPQVNRFKVR